MVSEHFSSNGVGRMSAITAESTDYEQDYYAWLMESAELLREGRLHHLDTVHLAEELEDMGKSERRAIESYLKVLIVHLLKWCYQPERRGASWELSIANARDALTRRLSDSPSLRAQLPDLVQVRYANARRHAALETGLAIETFPVDCPLTVEQLLDDAFFLGADAV
jgi:hypothetical protein